MIWFADYFRAVPWRIVSVLLICVGLVVASWRVNTWRAGWLEAESLRAQLAVEVACADGSACAGRSAGLEEAAQAASRVVVETYEQELSRVRASRPVRVVRVCPAPGDVQGAGSPGAADGSSPAAGVVSEPAGRDIGPDLYALAREADEVAARLRALQEWNRALSD